MTGRITLPLPLQGRTCYHARMKKRDQEPLKLMPLDEFGKLVSKIASVPKDAADSKGSLRVARAPTRQRRLKKEESAP